MSEGKHEGTTPSKKTPTKTSSKTTPPKAAKTAGKQTSNNTSKDLNQLPLARIRTIMKSAPDADMISQEALMMVCRASEMFIQQMTKESHKKSQKPNLLEYKDLAAVVASNEKLEFLASIIPKKITVREFKKRLAEESSSDEGSVENSEESESEEESEEEESAEEEESGEEETTKIDKNGTIELSSDDEK
ncbi:chromatin accessibility complex protein 1 [Culicoides brevitarsis]|uniref:chromatin accessibility complex protein 1 n=1 Tax=Culicoides brevitarsis TaxID=469753 RepID=UPI00307BBAFF